MNKLPVTRDSADAEPEKKDDNSYFRLIVSMADTTWRIFIPTIGLLLVGNSLDNTYGTKPWLMLGGAVIGGLIASWLVRRQLRIGS